MTKSLPPTNPNNASVNEVKDYRSQYVINKHQKNLNILIDSLERVIPNTFLSGYKTPCWETDSSKLLAQYQKIRARYMKQARGNHKVVSLSEAQKRQIEEQRRTANNAKLSEAERNQLEARRKRVAEIRRKQFEEKQRIAATKHVSHEKVQNLQPSTVVLEKQSKNPSFRTLLSLPDPPKPQNGHPDPPKPPIYRSKHIVCLPYFFLMGYPKCGTSKLYTLLLHHPDYVATVKEMHWWTKHNMSNNPEANELEIYQYLMYYSYNYTASVRRYPDRNVLGDCSASTAWYGTFNKSFEDLPSDALPYILYKFFPKSKFIAITRNPADRLRSDYYFFSGTEGHVPMALLNAGNLHLVANHTFRAYEACVRSGNPDFYCVHEYRRWLPSPLSPILKSWFRLEATMYYYTLKQWYKYFPKENILVLRNEDLYQNATAIALQMYDFLGFTQIPEKNLERLKQESTKEISYFSFHHMLKIQKMKNKTHSKSDLAEKVPEVDKTVYMEDRTRAMINEFFEPHNKKLAKFLEDDRFLWKQV